MVKLLSPDHEIHRRSGRPPMPRAHPTAIRHQILGLRSQGLSLVQIASQLLLPYSSVRRLCRRHRDDPARPLNPDYSRATASNPVILAVLDGNLVCSYNVYYWHIFNNHPNYGCKSLEYSQNFRSITMSGLPYLMKNPHFDAVALRTTPAAAVGTRRPPRQCSRPPAP